ncbi:BnaC03g49130D [Brassica napus]|uniref:BnaC03g49130D protein n=1 Tax=Brassica napus TaxID=3708 RepID=A0A078FNA2_BRANA|nr:BnaC03g49130D [Brassica napus]
MKSPSMYLSPQTGSGSTHMRISKLTVDSGATSTISLLIFKNNVVDVVGHLRLVNGQSLIDRPVLDEAEIISMRHVLEASFNCIATIDDVKRDSAWYYIGCSGCQTKATRGPSSGLLSLMCANCGNTNVSGVARYAF